MSDPTLELRHVSKRYPQAGGDLTILDDANLVVAPGELVALVAPSGAGKTTLLQIAGLLDKPTSGEVWIGGVRGDNASDDRRTAIRRDTMGFVYQFHHLLREFSALENVMMPQLIAGVTPKAAKARALELLDRLGLAPRAGHRPAQLSGGEQQRVAIARAIANKPVLLLADEPTGNLDPHTADGVFRLLMEMARSNNVSALVATHNPDLAARMDRRVTVKEGKILSV